MFFEIKTRTSTMNTTKIISTICLGIVLGLLVPDKEKKQLKFENQESKIQIEESKLIIEKFQEQNEKPGAFVLLDEDVISITFQNFEGEITWYQTHDLENTESEYTSINFYPIQDEKIISGKILNVPSNAYAFLVKGKIDGDTYSITYSHK
jgi:hypothetical protein